MIEPQSMHDGASAWVAKATFVPPRFSVIAAAAIEITLGSVAVPVGVAVVPIGMTVAGENRQLIPGCCLGRGGRCGLCLGSIGGVSLRGGWRSHRLGGIGLCRLRVSVVHE